MGFRRITNSEFAEVRLQRLDAFNAKTMLSILGRAQRTSPFKTFVNSKHSDVGTKNETLYWCVFIFSPACPCYTSCPWTCAICFSHYTLSRTAYFYQRRTSDIRKEPTTFNLFSLKVRCLDELFSQFSDTRVTVSNLTFPLDIQVINLDDFEVRGHCGHV